MDYTLYCNDVAAASFSYEKGRVSDYTAICKALLPMQIQRDSSDAFTGWINGRSIDLNVYQHRELMHALLGSRDKVAIAIKTNMYSVTDEYTCFPSGEFIPRKNLENRGGQEAISQFILYSSDTSLRMAGNITPNASTDGSFPKTWRYEEGRWWLYKRQHENAVKSEYAISRALLACGWDAAEYEMIPGRGALIKTLNFVGENEMFEPYESYRHRFDDLSDDETTVYRNIASLGSAFEADFRRILLADALFMNTDRHMRNFGVIRDCSTGETLRMAPNFDNNQAYKSNGEHPYSVAMLRDFKAVYGFAAGDVAGLMQLVEACGGIAYLRDAAQAGAGFIKALG